MARTLKGIRADENLTQAEFAKLFDVSLSTYQRYERGDVGNIPYSFIAKLMDKYNLSVKDIKL